MKCTVVVDNLAPVISGRPFLGEHGYSLLIEHHGKMILFDTGPSQTVIHNLSLLNVHPSQIDALVLSHGHYDHTGGLPHILKHGRKRYPIYAHSGIFAPHYALLGEYREYAGLAYSREHLCCLGADWQLGNEPREIFPNLWFSGGIPRRTGYEPGDGRLVTTRDGCDCPDPLADDSCLFYVCANGLVGIGGCTHSGLINTVRHGLEVTGATRLAGWIGGTHLGPAPKEQQAKTLQILEEMAPDFIMSGHCTGFAMMAELSSRFGNRFTPATVGACLELP